MIQTIVQTENSLPQTSNAVVKAVSMYPEHWDAVNTVSNQFGFRNNTSVALRFIVDQYVKMAKGDLSVLRSILWQAAKDNGYESVGSLLADLV
jgi:hypothetical protein